MSELSLSSRYLDLELEVEKFPIHAHAPRLELPRPSSRVAQTARRPLLPENSRNFRSTVDTWLLRRELELQARTDRKFLAEKEQLAQCTFRPRIKKFPGEISDPHPPFEHRLYADSRRRAETRRHAETLKTELEREEISDPVSTKKFPIENPIEQRTRELLKTRAARIEKMRSEISSANPFKPKISDRSRAIAEAVGRSSEPVETRLLRNFRSPLSRSSSPDERRSLRDVRPVSANFMRRQEAFVQGRAKKLEIVDGHVNRDCTFSPSISRKSRALSLGRGERNAQAVTQRLAVDYVEEQKRKMHEISVSSKPTFTPTITAMSEVLAANARSLAPVHDRLYREALEKAERQRLEAAASELESAANFETRETASLPAPPRNAKYEHVQPVYSYTDPDKLAATISDQISRREEKLQSLRAEREAQELAECTFNPKVGTFADFASSGTRTPRSARPVLVRGLDRFLELRRLAESQRLEEEERKRKVWQLDAIQKAPRKVITVPAPFNLSRSPKKGAFTPRSVGDTPLRLRL